MLLLLHAPKISGCISEHGRSIPLADVVTAFSIVVALCIVGAARYPMSMTSRNAKCSCGQLSVTCEGDPVSVSLCHCLECQRRTGSTYGIAAFFDQTCVGVTGESNEFVRPSDSGHFVTFHFCPRCGSSVFWKPARKPDLIAVAVGAFADPTFPQPTKSVYREHQHHWVEMPD